MDIKYCAPVKNLTTPNRVVIQRVWKNHYAVTLSPLSVCNKRIHVFVYKQISKCELVIYYYMLFNCVRFIFSNFLTCQLCE